MEDEMTRKRQRTGKGARKDNVDTTSGWNMGYETGRKRDLGRVWRREKPVLDSKTWANLPESVFLWVFRSLRWEDVFRFQVVCRDWNSFLRSSGFRRSWQKAPNQKPICFASSSSRNSYWNPSTDKWHLSGDDLLPSLCATQNDIPMDVPRNTTGRHFAVVSAANGYLLIQMYTVELSPQFARRYSGDLRTDHDIVLTLHLNEEPVLDNAHVIEGDVESEGSTVPDPWLEHGTLLLIMNPLLPPLKENIKTVRMRLSKEHGCKHEIVWDPSFCRYELISMHKDLIDHQEDGDSVWSIVFHRYDFVLDQWEKIVSWSTLGVTRLKSFLIINGKLVCLGRAITVSLSTIRVMPYRIYGMELSEFGSIEEMNQRAPVIPFDLKFAVLFYYEGMYMLAGGEVERVRSVVRLSSFKVWTKREVFGSQDSWTEAIVMPSNMLRHINELRDANTFSCKAEGRFLCIANQKTGVVMCDVKNRSWFKLPTHRFGQGAASEGLALCDPRFDVPLPSSLGRNQFRQ